MKANLHRDHASAPAIEHAKRVGLIEHGIATNLQQYSLHNRDAKAPENVGVILSTGSVGYVTEKTYAAYSRWHCRRLRLQTRG
jgi:hypothetical protein